MITGHAPASRATLFALIPVLVLVTLAAGCGTATAPRAAGVTGSTRPSAGRPATASPALASATPAAASPTPASGTPTAVPTTTSGPPVVPGQPACTGWPADVAHGTLPTSFVPVSVLRCVSGDQAIPGKGLWQTATLQRADRDLAALITALRLPPLPRTPGVMCNELAILPPQIVLISGDGKMLVPRLPVGGCGLIRPQVLAALAALPWQTVSVRLITQVQAQPA